MGGFDLGGLGTSAPILLILALLSVLSVAVLAARLIALAGVAGGRAARDAALDRGEVPTGTRPADRIARHAAELLGQGAAPDELTDALEHEGSAEVAAMSRGLRLLELVGMVAPLLGLLGTVLGMITSFRSLELASGAANAAILAGGIWQALLTTAAGLIVAIPALVGAAILAARVEAGTLEIERVASRATAAARRRAGT